MSKSDEIKLIINLLETLRKLFKITKSEIDKYAKLNVRQYSRMIEGNQSFDLGSLRNICNKIYNLSIKELLNLEGVYPKAEDLPREIQKLISGRVKVRSQTKLDLTSYLIIIINEYCILNEVINNKLIRPHLPKDLKDKAIELGKTTIRGFIEDINTDKDSTRKVYKLISVIPKEMIEAAKLTVDSLWLKEFEEKSNKK